MAKELDEILHRFEAQFERSVEIASKSPFARTKLIEALDQLSALQGRVNDLSAEYIDASSERQAEIEHDIADILLKIELICPGQ